MGCNITALTHWLLRKAIQVRDILLVPPRNSFEILQNTIKIFRRLSIHVCGGDAYKMI